MGSPSGRAGAVVRCGGGGASRRAGDVAAWADFWGGCAVAASRGAGLCS
eukprot:COSAG03_NODE_24933_length_269_cov_0.505882_1_plen_48_part_10